MARESFDDGGYRSGQLAAAAGVSADTLRYYERRGLLEPPRRLGNNYRLYPREALDGVRRIQRGLAIGFTLDELGVFLRVRKSGRPPCRQVRSGAAQRLEDVEREIERLRRFRDELRRLLDDWDERLLATPEGQPARLLETATPRVERLGPGGPRTMPRAGKEKEDTR
jgi:DNA-binding transcriptional MerR regulator